MTEKESYVRTLTKDEYRIFTQYIDKNYKEMYENKVTYEVNLVGEKFRVSIDNNNILSFDDIFK
jgi:hypothetical protein